MSFIQYLSNVCAKWLATKVPNDKYDTVEDQIEVYDYGFQVVWGFIVKGILLVSIALALGVAVPTLIIALTFASCRILFGGYHMQTYNKCITLSLTLFIGSAYLAQHSYQYLTASISYYLINIIVLLGIYIIYKYVPRDTPNKPITNELEIKKFKKWSYTYLAVWTFIMMICLTFNLKLILLSSCLGFLLNLSFIVPFGCKIYSKIDNSTPITIK